MTKFRDTAPPVRGSSRRGFKCNGPTSTSPGSCILRPTHGLPSMRRWQLFAELGFPYESVFAEYGFWLPRVRVEAEYHAPAMMSDWLRMRTHIEHVGASSVRWKTVFFNERTGDAGAAMTFIVAAIDATTKKSRPLPEPIRAALPRMRVAMLVAPGRIELREELAPLPPSGRHRRARPRGADRRNRSEDLPARTPEDADADALRSRVFGRRCGDRRRRDRVCARRSRSCACTRRLAESVFGARTRKKSSARA